MLKNFILTMLTPRHTELKPSLLTDKSRLQEIYDLRVTAYENSPKAIYVNKESFPNGWYDELDDRDETFHFVIEDKKRLLQQQDLQLLMTYGKLKTLMRPWKNLIFLYIGHLFIIAD